ncbi:nucleoside hydrolase [bacterium]|nr:nucleoside hydrolase [bacterium]
MPKRLIIDCDPGLGVPGADVDDNLAVLLALGSPEVELIGVTVTFGNTPLDDGLASLRRTLDAAGLDVPIYPGARQPGQVEQTTPASEFLADTVRAQPGQVHVLTLGPLGNLAAALQAAPSFADQLASLTLMAGAFRLPFFAQVGDPNIRWDLTAAQHVLATCTPKTMVSMDACLRAQFTAEHLQQFAASKTSLGQHLAAGIAPWLAKHTRMPGLRGFFPWDAVALAYLLQPGLFPTSQTRQLGLRGNGWRRATLRTDPTAAEIALPGRLDGHRFMNLLMTRLLRLVQDT